MSTLYILWDDSYLWGLLAQRAAACFGLPYKLVLAKDVPGLLATKPPALFLVPGGNARHKAEALGQEGCEAVRRYVRAGGVYIGFCGGAGLALSGRGGLALCPWERAGFDDRLQHFMSGHLSVTLPDRNTPGIADLFPVGYPDTPDLPVWWPGRFAEGDGSEVAVLASYLAPSHDFWLADLPTASLPKDIFAVWQDLYGFSATPTFLQGQPCVIHGQYGKGSYVLSYSHLETPDSPHANQFFAHLVKKLAGLGPTGQTLPGWSVWDMEPVWEDSTLQEVERLVRHVVQTGIEQGLLFTRNPWLLGWRTGIAGVNMNNLLAVVVTAKGKIPCNKALRFWKAHKAALLDAARFFNTGGVQYLLTERLAITLAKPLPDAVPQELLKQQREALFGPPMQAGGVYKDLIRPLDKLVYLQAGGE